MTMLLSKTLRLFLDSIGRRGEYEFYLNKFQAEQHDCFALLCPERTGFEQVTSVFSFDLEFLLKLELIPLIVLAGEDAGPMRNLLFVKGAQHPFVAYNLKRNAWKDSASSAQALADVGVFLEKCKAKARAGVLIAPDFSLQEVLLWLVPEISRRVHIIRVRGPLRNEDEDPLFYYYESGGNRVELAAVDKPLADALVDLLEQRPGTHISVASPLNLMRELFTVKGAGCVVRKGSAIHHFRHLDGVDMKRLIALLEDSFEKPLQRADQVGQMDELFLEESYRGAALLKRHPAGMYLSKFAVGTEARGEGLANELWNAVVAQHKALFWRAKITNPINTWYDRQADGSHKQDGWKVFWRGIKTDDIEDVIHFSLGLPEDFAPSPKTT